MTDLGAGKNRLVVASPDLFSRKVVPLPDRFSPVEARWGHDRRTILFTAPVPIGPRQDPHPAPPPGTTRREHVTLRDLDPVAAHRAVQARPTPSRRTRNQVFLRTADGDIRQLTDPWLEDWRDGVRQGDARSSSQPRMSADGRHVVVTNTSSTTGESFLLRIDLSTGEVLNLTNGTAGAMPTDDGDAAPAPDGNRLAFSYSDGSARGIYLMDARTGRDVRAVTDASDTALAPNWSADGSTLVYTRVRGSGSGVVRAQIDDRGRAGPPVVLSRRQSTAWAPVVAPEGDRIAFLAFAHGRVNVYASDESRTAARTLQPDRTHNVLSIDWR
jgi:Tol biopolymer transport system component